MKQLYLHIGTHKTGTTSIQAALARGGDFYYPNAGRRPEHGRGAHYDLSASSIDGIWPSLGYDTVTDHVWKSLIDESTGKDRVVVSSEYFCTAKPSDVERIRSWTDNLPVRVIVYFRNHFAYAVSMMRQKLKQGYFAGSFREHVEETIEALDYDWIARTWGEHFPVDVRLYDKAKRDLVGDLADAIGASSLQAAGRLNVAMKDDVLRSLRLAHRVMGTNKGEYPGDHPKLTRRVRQNIISGRFPGKYIAAAMRPLGPLVSDTDREWFMERTKEVRRRFVENHVNTEDRHYFD